MITLISSKKLGVCNNMRFTVADMNLFNFGSIFKIDSESSAVRSTVFSK